ncbi:flagellar hook-length control protein FliK [uncultured Paraglaciecola sp.]|uniref:flagellar hook-length control protein FliK n=1 Tax=uncultured Paraglaciecola sp. TaxID=1765024 RepID=UPI00262A53DE|nr:flagellar hook-length control protein FliK [uncultured Paraglaciecola sp.]
MSDISQSSLAAISQALTQLSQLAPTSEAARQGVDVLVKHLAGNVLSLTKGNSLLHKTALLAAPQITGKLAEAEIHQVKLNSEPSPSLAFFSKASTQAISTVPLNEQQLQALLKLPANQLFSKNLQGQLSSAIKLPVLRATVLALPSKEQLNTQEIKSQVASHPIAATDTAAVKRQNTLQLGLSGQRPPFEISLPVKSLTSFDVGEKVTLTLTPKGQNWQVSIAQHQNLPDARMNPVVADTTSKSQQSILSPAAATALIKASMLEPKLSAPIELELPIKQALQQLSKVDTSQHLLKQLQALPIEKLTLQVKPSGDIELQLQSTKPVANIPITKEIAQALAVLKLPNQQAIIKSFDLLNDAKKEAQLSSQVSRALLASDISKNLTIETHSKSPLPKVDGSQHQDAGISLKQARADLLTVVQNSPIHQSVISPSLLSNKAEQSNLVQTLLRIVQPKAEAPTLGLQSLEKAFNDGDFFKSAPEQPSKQVLAEIMQQIKLSLPQGREQDANQIKQLLTTPALNLSALQMVNPTSSQGFMSGLVTLLQMSLSARLSRHQSSRAEHITTTLNSVLSHSSTAKVTPKAMTEMSQLEQKHQLMKEIGRLFAGHQTSKLSNAEQMLQGQDSFYYNLPSALGGVVRDIELLIKREDDSKDPASSDKQAPKTWQLTMKLGVGELGELLTKAKLSGDTLDINFYASNETVKIQVMNYLPLLRRKFASLGIEVSNSQCQLGKIPDSLQKRPYHVFQAKA